MNWGNTDDEVSMRALNETVEQGVNLFDTADVYGFGYSEKFISQLIQTYGRDKIIVATKAGNDFYNATTKDNDGYGPTRQTHLKKSNRWCLEKSVTIEYLSNRYFAAT